MILTEQQLYTSTCMLSQHAINVFHFNPCIYMLKTCMLEITSWVYKYLNDIYIYKFFIQHKYLVFCRASYNTQDICCAGICAQYIQAIAIQGLVYYSYSCILYRVLHNISYGTLYRNLYSTRACIVHGLV